MSRNNQVVWVLICVASNLAITTYSGLVNRKIRQANHSLQQELDSVKTVNSAYNNQLSYFYLLADCDSCIKNYDKLSGETRQIVGTLSDILDRRKTYAQAVGVERPSWDTIHHTNK